MTWRGPWDALTEADRDALRIEDGCTSSFYAPSIPTV